MLRNSPRSTHKKVAVRKLNDEWVKGYVDPQTYLGPSGIELLDREGRLLTVPLDAVKCVHFVREFDANDKRLERRASQGRQKANGLWVRLTFRDGEIMEGLTGTDLLAADPRGFLVTPEDLDSNNIRVFVPRTALIGVEAMGVASNGAKRRALLRAAATRRADEGLPKQIRLFPPAADTKTK